MIRTAFIIMLSLLAAGPAAAQTWNAVNAQFLYGAAFELGPEEVETLTVEWTNGWTYGDNFTFFDITRPFGGGTTIYGEWAPRLSFSKMTGGKLSAGPIQDMLLSGALEMGEGITNYLVGGAVDFAVPGFNFFQVNGYLKENPDLAGTTWQVTMAWDAAFVTGPMRWAFLGFFDWVGSEGNAGTFFAYEKRNFQAQPQLLLDVGHLLGRSDRLYVGIEWLHWRNKFGVAGVNESATQVMIKVTF